MKKLFVFVLALVLGLSAASVAMAGCAKHPDAYDSYHPYTEYRDWSASHHKTLWDDVVFCGECDEVVSYDWGESLDPHDYYNGYCQWCGHRENDVPSYEELQAEALQRITEDPEGIAGKMSIVMHNGNVRAEASNESADLGAVTAGNEHEIVGYQIAEENRIWLEIKYLDGTAWISASLARISGDHVLDGEFAAVYIGRTCKIKVSSGRARVAPGKKNPEIAYVHHEEKYVIQDAQAASDGTLWFQIKVDGTDCWISSGLADVY